MNQDEPLISLQDVVTANNDLNVCVRCQITVQGKALLYSTSHKALSNFAEHLVSMLTPWCQVKAGPENPKSINPLWLTQFAKLLDAPSPVLLSLHLRMQLKYLIRSQGPLIVILFNLLHRCFLMLGLGLAYTAVESHSFRPDETTPRMQEISMRISLLNSDLFLIPN